MMLGFFWRHEEILFLSKKTMRTMMTVERTVIVIMRDQSESMRVEVADWSRTQISSTGVQDPSAEHWDRGTRSKSTSEVIK